MKNVKALLINILWLTGTSLLIRVVGVGFQVYLSNTIGAEGIGLFSLILSVHTLFITFALSGIRLAVTRLVSEELGVSNPSGARAALRRCVVYAAAFGLLASLALFFGAPAIGTHWIGNTKSILSLRLLALSLPFMGLSSVFCGYFTAVRKASRCAIAQIIEQIVRMGIIVAILVLIAPRGLELACASVVAGSVLSEFTMFLFLALLYFFEKKRATKRAPSSRRLTRRMLSIALPVAVSSYFRTALSTLEHMLIPRALKRSGSSESAALRGYGIVHGMVFPVLLLPTCLLYSLADLLVPELSESHARGEKLHLRYIIERVFHTSFLFIVFVMATFFFFADELGQVIYAQVDISYYLRLFAPLILLMYADIVIDGILKGLGQQFSCMVINVVDSGVSVLLILLLVPRYGVMGYVMVIMIGEGLNFALSLARLFRVAEFKLPIKRLLLMILAASAAALISSTLCAPLPLSGVSAAAVPIVLSLLFYLLLCRLLSAIRREEFQWFRTLFRR